MEITELKTVNHLPVEVIEEIFKMLPTADLKNTSVVCRQWYEISQLRNVQKNIQLKIEGPNLTSFIKVFENSTRKFSNFYVADTDLKILSHISNIFQNLEYFYLYEVDLTYKLLLSILAQMPVLKDLSLVDCIIKDDDEEPIEQISENQLKVLKNIMSNLISFEFQTDLYTFNDKTISEMTDMLVNLKQLKVKSILFLEEDAKWICSVIENNKNTLQQLDISQKFGIEFIVPKVYQTKFINLEYLSISLENISTIGVTRLNKFLQEHTNIRALVLCSVYQNIDLDFIAENMKQLEQLEIEICEDDCKIYNSNLKTISKLKKLKTFKVDNNFISNDENASNVTLKVLDINFSDMAEIDIINVSKGLPNLEILILKIGSLTDNGLQSMTKNLINLKYLSLTIYSDRSVIDDRINGITSNASERILQYRRYIKLVVKPEVMRKYFEQQQQVDEMGIRCLPSVHSIRNVFTNCTKLVHIEVERTYLGPVTLRRSDWL